jgi:hypothetical protein
MSIPTTEIQPDGPQLFTFRKAGSLKNALRTLGPKEINDFLEELLRRNKLTSSWLWQMLSSLPILIVGLLADLPLLILVSAVLAPVLNPLLGVSLSTTIPKPRHLAKSILAILLICLLFCLVGWLITLFSPIAINQSQTTNSFVLKNGLLEWAVLLGSCLLSVFLFFHKPNGPSVLPSSTFFYLIALPIVFAGANLNQGNLSNFLYFLSLAGIRLFASIIIMSVSIWLFSLSPKGVFGWLVFAFGLALTALCGFVMLNQAPNSVSPNAEQIPSAQIGPVNPTDLPSPTALPATPTATIKPTDNPKPTATVQLKPSSTPLPVTRQALVISESGIVVRKSPSIQADIVTYINNGMLITLLGEQSEDGTMLWEKVLTPDGFEGWASSRFLQITEP